MTDLEIAVDGVEQSVNGTNFENLPGLTRPYGYPVVVPYRRFEKVQWL